MVAKVRLIIEKEKFFNVFWVYERWKVDIYYIFRNFDGLFCTYE